MKYFGTDGIRNKAEFFLNNSFAYKVGRSLSLLYNNNLYIGYDTRCSGQAICHMLMSGATSLGINVYNLQMASTPCIAYYSLLNKAIGVSITASHNPYLDNGIKIFINGEKINNEQMKEIEEYIDNNIDSSYTYGTIQNKCPLEYISFLNQFKTNTSDCIIDTANGATSEFAKFFFKNVICNEPNGININNNCGSTHINNIIENTTNIYKYGISIDGDGDRLIIVDNNGNIYSGDLLAYILSLLYKEKEIVLTKMVNPGILSFYTDNNITVHLSNIGDSNVFNKMMENNIYIGAEDSGHIINRHLLPFGDGLLNALIIIKYLNDYNINLSDIINPNIKYPEILINYPNLSSKQIDKIKEIEKTYSNILDFKLLFRKSGTENIYRLYLSSKDESFLNKAIEEINNG